MGVNTRTFAYETATVVCTVSSGLNHVTVSGIVTPEVGGLILRDNAAWLRETGAAGQVADYRGAAMAMDADTLLSAAQRVVLREPALDTPTALVLRSENLDLFERYSAMMAQAGITRAPFVDVDRAAAWAARQARALRSLPSLGGSDPAGGHTKPAADPQAPRRTAGPAQPRR